ncbi:carboxypeptidase regulatory-like domain-containing protein [Candidatus Bipolaricaulota sp. J31]
MKRAKYLFLALLGLSALILAGCLFVPARPTGKIVGHVVDAGAGSPVAGARVTAYPLADDGKPIYWVGSSYFTPTVLTDDEGYYELVVPEGTYVVVAEKEGFATTRVEGVVVASTYRLDIIERPVFNPNWSLESPEVTLTIEGQSVNPGDTIVLDVAALADGLDYRVDARGPNDIDAIYVALGKTPGWGWLVGHREAFFSTYTTGDASLNPANYGVEGWTSFEVVVYDMNENRTHILCKVYVPETSGPPSLQPANNPKVLAVTLGKKVEFRSETFTIPSGTGDIEIHAAPPGGNLYVELTWDASSDDADITGYRIYRKLVGEADYTLIGTVAPAGDPTATYLFRDSSPALQPGVEVTYQVRAYKGTTESEAIGASTIPLDIWDVRLLEPADGATGVSLTPTFHWEPTKTVGNDQYYLWVLWDLALGADLWYVYGEFLNETEFEFSGIPGTPYERLQPHRVYQWYIGLAIAYDDFTDPTAVSVAVNDWWTTDYPYWSMPATDLFTFTTGDW